MTFNSSRILYGLNPSSPICCRTGDQELIYQQRDTRGSLTFPWADDAEHLWAYFHMIRVINCPTPLYFIWKMINYSYLCKAQNYWWQEQSIIMGEQLLTT